MERRTGILSLLFLFFVLLYFTYTDFIHSKKHYYNIEVFFTFLESIYTGSPVKLNGGFTIGFVTKIKTSEKGHTVYCKIRSKYKIPKKNTFFHIKTTGMIGPKYINIYVSQSKITKNTLFIQDNDKFQGIPPGNFNQSLQYFYQMFTDTPPPDDYNLGKILLRTLKNVKNLKKYSSGFKNDFSKNLKKTKNFTKSFSETLKEVINILENNSIIINNLDKKTFQNYQNTIDSFYNTIYKVSLAIYKGKASHSEIIGKLLFEDTQYEKDLQFSEYINTLLAIFAKEPYRVLNN